jgi:hypothetical protein
MPAAHLNDRVTKCRLELPGERMFAVEGSRRALRKKNGDASLHPRIFRFILPEAVYLFFLAFAFFFAGIIFSSQLL